MAHLYVIMTTYFDPMCNVEPEIMWWSKNTLEFHFGPNLGLRIISLDQAEQYVARKISVCLCGQSHKIMAL